MSFCSCSLNFTFFASISASFSFKVASFLLNSASRLFRESFAYLNLASLTLT
jgi:hypothetical protein